MTDKTKANGKITMGALLVASLSFTAGTLLPWITGNTTNVARLEERVISVQEDVREVKDLINKLHPPKE
jgi:hypothetical protein